MLYFVQFGFTAPKPGLLFMKMLDWQNFFAKQKELYGKMIFSVAELANVAGG